MVNSLKTGEFISRLRKEKDMTQLSLVAALQVTYQAISKRETGTALPDIEMLLSLSKSFDVSIESLLQGEELHDDSCNKDDIKKLLSSNHEIMRNNNTVPSLFQSVSLALDLYIARAFLY